MMPEMPGCFTSQANGRKFTAEDILAIAEEIKAMTGRESFQVYVADKEVIAELKNRLVVTKVGDIPFISIEIITPEESFRRGIDDLKRRVADGLPISFE